jgi:bisphosphoglycerate-independent phosphoglycerate mutase (AlkP superfamily)
MSAAAVTDVIIAAIETHFSLIVINYANTIWWDIRVIGSLWASCETVDHCVRTLD